MRSLHIAALPFPSPQGTQAAIASMLRALTELGHEAHLLTYGHGAGDASSHAFTHHRAADVSVARSLRSGPSLEKCALDVLLAQRAHALVRELRPELVVAHHVEAALACHATGIPHVFVAHTALDWELPSYVPRLGAWTSVAGGALDEWLVRRSLAACAVGPALASHLRARSHRSVRYLPIPWVTASPLHKDERERARAHYRIAPSAQVMGYVGNADAYQGLDALPSLLRALVARGRDVFLLVGTASDTRSLARSFADSGVAERCHITTLGDETVRRRLHAACDVMLVPRAVAGGVPVKLLDAFARGCAVVSDETATSGLELEGACRVASKALFAADVELLLDNAPLRQALAGNARAYLTREHSASRFVAEFEAAARDAGAC